MRRSLIIVCGLAVVSACQKGDPASQNGYQRVDPAAIKRQGVILDKWRDCVVYGIGQVDTPRASATEVAEAAVAGCARGQTALSDELFRDMSGPGNDPRMVRMAADSTAKDIAGEVRDQAVRWVLQKRQEESGSVRR